MDGSRWEGWPSAGAQGPGGWLDLSHPIHEGLPRIGFFPRPRVGRFRSMPGDPMNVTELHMVCHVGTHVDAPRHFIPDGPAIDEIPLERLYGPGVVWRVDLPSYGVLEPDRLERLEPPVRPGDILLLDTGWSQHFGTDRYLEHPSLSVAAARWLVERGVKLLGVDFATPDLAANLRPSGFDWPVHHVLLSRGVLIAEHLTNLRPLAGRRIEVMFLAINVRGADGAPARVLARAVD